MWPSMRALWTTIAPWPSQNLSSRSFSSRPTLNTGFEDTTNSPYYCIILYVRMWPSMRALWTTVAAWPSQNLSSRSFSSRPTLNTGFEDTTNSPYYCIILYVRMWPSMRALWTTVAAWPSQNLSSRSFSKRPTLNTGFEDTTNSPYYCIILYVRM